MDFITKQGFDFAFYPKACKGCNGLCCRGGAGNIWVTPGEIEAICRLLNINMIDGIKLYFKRVNNRFSIKEIESGDECPCIFLEPQKGCLIYAARPSQCRTFPFWNYFRTCKEELLIQCPGIKLL